MKAKEGGRGREAQIDGKLLVAAAEVKAKAIAKAIAAAAAAATITTEKRRG